MKFFFNKKKFKILKFVDILVFLEKVQPKEINLHKHFLKKYNENNNFNSFYETTQLLNVLLKLFYNLENLIPILHRKNSQFSGIFIYRILKKFFKKITNTIKFSEKNPSKDFRYFWIFKKRGYYWRRNYIFYKTNKIDTINDYKLSKLFLKINFLKNIKFLWSFSKKLNIPLNTEEIKKKKKTKKKKKIYWIKWKILSQYCFYKNLYYPIYQSNFFITTYLVLVFFMLSKLKLFYKNLRKIRVKEKSYISIRKRFSAYYVFRTFEYAYHQYWNTYKYINLLNFLKNFFKNNSYCVRNLFLFEEIKLNKQKFNFFVYFSKNLMWKKQRRVVTKDDRGYFSWERRHFKKRRKFKKIFLIKSILNKSFFFKNNFFTFGLINLIHNLNKTSTTSFNYVFDNSLIKSGELVDNFFSKNFFDENCVKKKLFFNFKKNGYYPIIIQLFFYRNQLKKFFLKKKFSWLILLIINIYNFI